MVYSYMNANKRSDLDAKTLRIPQLVMQTERSIASQTHQDGRRESVLIASIVFYGVLQKAYLKGPQNVARLDMENVITINMETRH